MLPLGFRAWMFKNENHRKGFLAVAVDLEWKVKALAENFEEKKKTQLRQRNGTK